MCNSILFQISWFTVIYVRFSGHCFTIKTLKDKSKNIFIEFLLLLLLNVYITFFIDRQMIKWMCLSGTKISKLHISWCNNDLFSCNNKVVVKSIISQRSDLKLIIVRNYNLLVIFWFRQAVFLLEFKISYRILKVICVFWFIHEKLFTCKNLSFKAIYIHFLTWEWDTSITKVVKNLSSNDLSYDIFSYFDTCTLTVDRMPPWHRHNYQAQCCVHDFTQIVC